jgi:hypothetical protein
MTTALNPLPVALPAIILRSLGKSPGSGAGYVNVDSAFSPERLNLWAAAKTKGSRIFC